MNLVRTPDRCMHCGKKAVTQKTGSDDVTYGFCHAHRDRRACSMCGSYGHSAGHGHPEFWGSPEDRRKFMENICEHPVGSSSGRRICGKPRPCHLHEETTMSDENETEVPTETNTDTPADPAEVAVDDAEEDEDGEDDDMEEDEESESEDEE